MPNRPGDRARRPREAGTTRLAALGGLLVVVLALVVGGALGGAGPAGPSTAGSPTLAARSPGASDGHPTGSPAATSGSPATPSPSASASARPEPSPEPSEGIPATALQARLDSLRRKLAIPGVSVAIRWDDGREWLGVSGWADVASRAEMTTGTAFALASVSKTFTAAVVLQLVEEGRLQLEQPVAPMLPDYLLDPRITVRMLLDHTSGLPDYFLNVKIDRPLQRTPDADWTPLEAWRYVAAGGREPGTRWRYSNSNYLLLGELVAAVTGRPLAEEVRERLLDPLRLGTAWYQVAEAPRAPGATGYRLVAKPGGGFRPVAVAPASDVMPFRSVVSAAGGAGGIAATAGDAARWMASLCGGDILGPAMRSAMLTPATVQGKRPVRVPYGLGVQVSTIADRFAIGHSGRFLGFRNVVRHLPGEGITIAVLTNQNSRDPARIAQALLRVLLPPPPKPSPSPSPSASAASPSPSAPAPGR